MLHTTTNRGLYESVSERVLADSACPGARATIDFDFIFSRKALLGENRILAVEAAK